MMLMNANRINPFMLVGSSSAILPRSLPAHPRELQITLDPNSPSDDTILGGRWGKDDLVHFFHLPFYPSFAAYSCILFAVYLTDVFRVYRLQGLIFSPIKNHKINTAR
jgi:hypothetical protein